jgi:hypothetical protein
VTCAKCLLKITPTRPNLIVGLVGARGTES